MPEVISLCESDDDECTPTTVSRKGRPPQTAVTSGGVIDLLDDSDEEEQPSKASGKVPTVASAPPAVTQDEECTTVGTTGKKPQTQQPIRHSQQQRHNGTTTAPTGTKLTSGLAPPSHQPSNHLKQNSARSGRSCTEDAIDNDSDDSDDDSVLHYDCGLFNSKKATITTETKTPAHSSVPHHRSSSSLNKRTISSGTTCTVSTFVTPRNARVEQQKMAPSAQRNPSPPVVIANPYANTTPKPSPAVITTNPYVKTPVTSAGDSRPSTAITPKTATATKTTMRRASLPVTKDSSSSSSSQLMVEYPSLLSKSKSHGDIRAKFMLAFWKYSRMLCFKSYDRPKLDQIAKKIVALALSEYPMRSLDEYCARTYKVGGIGTSSGKSKREDIKYELDKGGLNGFSTPVDDCRDGRYFSIVEACLVSILIYVEGKLRAKNLTLHSVDDARLCTMLSEKTMWMALQDLIPEIDQRLKDCCPGRLGRPSDSDWGAAHLTDKSTRSAEYKQIEKLLVGDIPYLKEHKRTGEVVFEMTLLGCQTAQRIRTRQFPSPPGHYRCSNLTNVQARYGKICLGVDMREGGGSGNVLHIMCNKLEMTKIPYFVGSLSIGDYVFFSGNKLVPILVERKSIEDIATSIHDGRWKKQKQRMYHGQFVFGYDNSRIAFIIEGKEEKQQVTGGYIGRRMFNVDRQRLDDEIENLKSEGFEVLRTTSPENSMFELSRWAQQVQTDVQSGKLTIKYTYEEFKEEVKKIPPTTDFSRLAKDAMETKNLAETAAKRPLSIDMDSDSDIEVLEPSYLTYERNGEERKVPAKKQKMDRVPPRIQSAKVESATTKQPSCEYGKLSVSDLQKICEGFGLTKSGNKAVLIERLKGPRPPTVWLERKKAGQYVPSSHDCGATALLVGLYLLEKDAGPDHSGFFEKDVLYSKAEELCITKNPFSGGTTQTGPYHYDGWSNMSRLLDGDPPLVLRKKNRFKLTRCCSTAGYQLAVALHGWCHEHGNCNCGRPGLK